MKKRNSKIIFKVAILSRKKVKLEERVFFSLASAIIATIWHYVGVSVRGFAIPTK